MQCPHCQQEFEPAEGQELELIECEKCGQGSMSGAKYCYQCGHSFEAEPDTEVETEAETEAEAEAEAEAEVEMQECPKCMHMASVDDKFCAECGESLKPKPKAKGKGKAPKKRVACSDGMCIGIIGPDGKCTECGKPYEG